MLFKLTNGWEIESTGHTATRVVEDEIFTKQVYRRNNIQFKDGDVIVDAGANVGMFSLWLNTFLTKAFVITLEPCVESYRMMLANLKRHDHLGVFTNNHALWDSLSPCVLQECASLPQTNSTVGWSKLQYEVNVRHVVEAMQRIAPLPAWSIRWLARVILAWKMRSLPKTCSTTTIDELCKRYGVGHVDLLKLDVEGAELRILRSTKPNCNSVRQIVCEVHDPKELPEVQSLLKAAGYTVATDWEPNQLPMVYARA